MSVGGLSRRLRDDRGAALVMVIPVVVGLMIGALLVIRMLGSATSQSRQARAAADAAALAGAKAWDTAITTAFDTAVAAGEAGDSVGFFAFIELTPGAHRSAAIAAAASSYAAANGSSVVSVSTNPVAGTVTVTVRDDGKVPQSGQQLEHTSTAKLAFTGGGACRAGGIVGLRISGACVVVRNPVPIVPFTLPPGFVPTIDLTETLVG